MLGTTTSTFNATCVQPFSTTCEVICLNRPSIIPAAWGVIERSMALSDKARILARSTLVLRPAALRSSSGLAADSGLILKPIRHRILETVHTPLANPRICSLMEIVYIGVGLRGRSSLTSHVSVRLCSHCRGLTSC